MFCYVHAPECSFYSVLGHKYIIIIIIIITYVNNIVQYYTGIYRAIEVFKNTVSQSKVVSITCRTS
jgi:hypothetical protein